MITSLSQVIGRRFHYLIPYGAFRISGTIHAVLPPFKPLSHLEVQTYFGLQPGSRLYEAHLKGCKVIRLVIRKPSGSLVVVPERYFPPLLLEDLRNYFSQKEGTQKMKTKSKKQKSQFMISALQTDSSAFGCLKKFDTKLEAIEHAKAVIERRRANGSTTLNFYVLKTVAVVGPVEAPVKVVDLK